MKELAVIIPMHEFGKENIEMVNKAIQSVPNGIAVYISVPKGTSEAKIKNIPSSVTRIVSENDGTTFVDLVNNGVKHLNKDIKWFSILEFDDTYTPIWFDNFKKYADYYNDISVFVPLEDLIDANDGKFIGIGNEAPWASSFSNEIGYIDNDCLQNFFDFYMTGAIFNVEDWVEVGGLKPEIKLTFWYEFLLRATHKGKKVFVIPKVGYSHMLGRKGSLIENYKKTIDDKESNFWVSVARKEYFYKESRDKSKYEYKAEENKNDE